MKCIFFPTLIIGLLSLSSCSKLYDWNQPKEKGIEYSVIWPMSGEWFVTYKLEDGTDVLGGYTKLFTFNTASESTSEFWITDHESGSPNFWDFRAKCPINLGTTTFGSNDLIQNESYEIKMKITEGKIILKGGFSLSNVVTDSIYMKLEFSDDPGTIYIASGVRRTGFLEDEADQ